MASNLETIWDRGGYAVVDMADNGSYRVVSRHSDQAAAYREMKRLDQRLAYFAMIHANAAAAKAAGYVGRVHSLDPLS